MGKGDTQGSSYLNPYFCHLISLGSSRCLFPLRCHFPDCSEFSHCFSFSYNSLDPAGCFSYFSVLMVTCDSFLGLWTSRSASPRSFRELYWTEPRLSPLWLLLCLRAHRSSQEHSNIPCPGLTWVPRQQHSFGSASKSVISLTLRIST